MNHGVRGQSGDTGPVEALLVRTDEAAVPVNLLERAIGAIYRPETERPDGPVGRRVGRPLQG